MYRTAIVAAMTLGALSVAQGLPTTNMYAPVNKTGEEGAVAPFATPEPQYAGLYSAPETCNACEISAFYGMRCGRDHYFSPDMGGLDVTFSHYFTPRQAVTLTLLAAAGSDESHYYWPHEDGNYYRYENSFTRSDFALMGGYRFTQPIGRYATLTAGVKAGLDVQYLDVDDCLDEWGHRHHDGYNAHGLGAGLGYAGYMELGFRVSADTRITVGYQFYGATSRPTAKDDEFPESTSYKTKPLYRHEFRLGVEFRF